MRPELQKIMLEKCGLNNKLGSSGKNCLDMLDQTLSESFSLEAPSGLKI